MKQETANSPGDLGMYGDGMYFRIGASLLRHIRWVAIVPIVLVLAVAAVTIIQRPQYAASSTFLPQVGQSALARFAGIATQFGVNIPSSAGAGGESIAFYVELLRSRAILERLVSSRFPSGQVGLSEGADSLDLVQVLGIEADNEQEKIRLAIDAVSRRVSVTPSNASGVVRLVTTAPSPELAVAMNRRLLDLLGEFNLQRRQSQAAAERAFAEARLTEAKEELQGAESQLQRFLEVNRNYQSSPQLSFEAARLQRTVDHRQQLYSAIAHAFDQARLEEVRNTPVVTIVDSPEGSAERIGRSLGLKLILATVLGVILGGGGAVLRDHVDRRKKAKPEEFAEIRALWKSAAKRLTKGDSDSEH